MTLNEKQKLFPRLISKLIEYVYSNGYELTFGEAWRSPETAALYAKQKKGIKNSLHIDRIAFDILLFKNGKYLTDSKDYEWLGKYWESLGGILFETCWGGRFGDGNHFSIMHDGRK